MAAAVTRALAANGRKSAILTARSAWHAAAAHSMTRLSSAEARAWRRPLTYHDYFTQLSHRQNFSSDRSVPAAACNQAQRSFSSPAADPAPPPVKSKPCLDGPDPDNGKHSKRGRVVSNWNVANALTIGRLAAAPVVAHFIITDQHTLAIATAGLAGLTDVADGFIARRYGLQTTLGSYLDPFADKLLVACASGALAVSGVLPMWLVGAIVGRDTLFVSIAVVLWARTAPAPWYRGIWDVVSLPPLVIDPLPISKVNTALQLVLTAAGIAHAGHYAIVSESMLNVLIIATASTTVGSTAAYADKFFGFAAARKATKVQR
jgi:cardiolipin synthase (CMP-forming)